MMKNRKFLLFLAVAVLFAAPARSAGLPAIPDKSGVTVKGYVACEGRGIEGVVVSDGFNVTKTDAEGRYWLKTKLSRSEFVMISTPRGYDPEVYSGFLPKFFYALDKTADKRAFSSSTSTSHAPPTTTTRCSSWPTNTSRAV